MRHKYFRFLACVAMVLVTSMVLAIPASAVGNINLDDYQISSTGSGLEKTVQYYYKGSSDCVGGYYVGKNYVALSALYQDHYSLTSSEALSFCTLIYSPLENSIISQKDEFFLLPDFGSFYLNSLEVALEASVFASRPLSGSVDVKVSFFSNGSNIGTHFNNTVRFSAADYSGEYVYLTPSCTVSGDVDLSLYDKFSVSVQFSFSGVQAGDTVGFDCAAHSAVDDLDHGILITAELGRNHEKPVITQNLVSSYVYLVGNPASALNIDATTSDGGTLSYQWYKSTVSGADGSVISGATGKSFVPDTTVESECYYYCVVANTIDGIKKTTKSNYCKVSVIKQPVAPMIITDLNTTEIPEFYQNLASDKLEINAISTDGGALSYQWWTNTVDSYDGAVMIGGATSSFYRPPTSELGFRYYFCVVTNSKGDYKASVNSRITGICVIPAPDPALPPVIVTDLPSTAIMYKQGDASSPLRIGAQSPDDGELSYQWYEEVKGSAIVLAGEINPYFSPGTAVPGEYVYYVVVTNRLLHTTATATSAKVTVIVEEDRTDSLLDMIAGGMSDLIDGITNLPQMILDGIKGLFVPDVWQMAAYRDKWMELLSSRFGAVYEAVMLIDQFGQAISEQAAMGIVTFPEVSFDLAGTPWTFGGWDIKVVPDGFGGVIVVLKSAVNIVCTLAFVNGLRHRFEGIMGGA